MKLPWQKSDAEQSQTADRPAIDDGSDLNAQEAHLPKGYTPKKGRPTPKRRDREIERGVIRPANRVQQTPKQRREERKKLKESMSAEEWKNFKRKEREESRRHRLETQAAMDRGEERYLLPRDKGPERRFARDWVDARRFFSNLVMPVALAMLAIMFLGQFAPKFANVASFIALGIIVVFAIEGVIIGRKVNRAVRNHFPGTLAAGFGLGFYAYSRATQPRKWRSPRPQVELGADIN